RATPPPARNAPPARKRYRSKTLQKEDWCHPTGAGPSGSFYRKASLKGTLTNLTKAILPRDGEPDTRQLKREAAIGANSWLFIRGRGKTYEVFFKHKYRFEKVNNIVETKCSGDVEIKYYDGEQP